MSDGEKGGAVMRSELAVSDMGRESTEGWEGREDVPTVGGADEEEARLCRTEE